MQGNDIEIECNFQNFKIHFGSLSKKLICYELAQPREPPSAFLTDFKGQLLRTGPWNDLETCGSFKPIHSPMYNPKIELK